MRHPYDDDPGWRQHGACWNRTDLQPVMVPESVANFTNGRFRPGPLQPRWRTATLICQPCPVTDLCLQYALDNRIPFGVWGGQTPLQRKQTRKVAV